MMDFTAAFETVKNLIRSGKLEDSLIMLDRIHESLPPDFHKLGDTHVIVPNPANMTSEMYDAPRSVVLYTDVMDNSNAERLRKMLLMKPHYAKYLPQWFLEAEGHLTKADRIELIYTLTVAGYLDPEPQEVIRPNKELQKWSFTLKHEDIEESLVISHEYTRSVFMKPYDVIDLKLNRHQLPERWRKMFRKNAIDLAVTVEKEDRQYKVASKEWRLGLKAEHVGKVTAEFDDGSQ